MPYSPVIWNEPPPESHTTAPFGDGTRAHAVWYPKRASSSCETTWSLTPDLLCNSSRYSLPFRACLKTAVAIPAMGCTHPNSVAFAAYTRCDVYIEGKWSHWSLSSLQKRIHESETDTLAIHNVNQLETSRDVINCISLCATIFLNKMYWMRKKKICG